jgi:hypothetical protein
MRLALLPTLALLVSARRAQEEVLSIRGGEAGERLCACVGFTGDLDGDGVPSGSSRGAETAAS